MRKFYTGVVNHRKTIIGLFVFAAIICAFLQTLVSVNYDMNDYLPADTHSTVSLEVMKEEFDGGIPNTRVMVQDVSVPEALEYKEAIEAVDGVQAVSWLDDVMDITQPLSSVNTATVETYYKDDNALFTVTITEDKRISAISDIREIVGEENAISGNAASTVAATLSTVVEVAKIAAIGVAFAFIVLLFTTKSWLQPFLILGGLGVAIVINGGTNLIFGEISFVTNAAGSILQLAVSLDYSVFLIHRFEECRKDIADPKEAMVEALCKSTNSILSSGLTTVIGFLALILMRFLIGPDLGMALAKGVAISLITVFIFMPCLILVSCKLTDKLRHRSFVPDLHGFGKGVRKVMFPMVIVFAIVLIPAYLASNANDFYYGAGHMFSEETQYGADTKAIEQIFGQKDTYVLLVPNESTAIEAELSNKLHQIPQVTSIISYVDMAGAEIPMEYLDEDTLALLVSENYSRMVITVNADYEGEETFALVEQIRELANTYYPDSYYLAGQGISTYDLMDTVTADMLKVNLLAILAVFVVLLVLTKNLALPIILVLSIETAIWINLALPYFMGNHVFYIAYLIISSVQLGATVDYAILMSDRYREFRLTYDKKTAIVETVSAVTVSIMTTGSVFSVVGFLMGYVSTNQLLAQLGVFLGVGGMCSVVIVLFVLPGLLYLFDKLFVKKQEVV